MWPYHGLHAALLRTLVGSVSRGSHAPQAQERRRKEFVEFLKVDLPKGPSTILTESTAWAIVHLGTLEER